MAPPTTTDLALSKPPGYVVSGERQDALTQEMRDRIVKRIYLPGQRLTERELAEEFGVSRSMVRDALNVLAERRLVVRSANRGVEVARIGRAEVIEIYEVREAVEGLLARMASERAPDGTWDDLLDLFGEPATDAVERQDVEAYSVMLDQLSERTVAMAGNSILSDLQLPPERPDRDPVAACALPSRAHEGGTCRPSRRAFRHGRAPAGRCRAPETRQPAGGTRDVAGFRCLRPMSAHPGRAFCRP